MASARAAAARQRGIGRGLAAILPETPEQAAELRRLPVDIIRPNPDQPRTRFDSETISELAHSIETAGVVQPLIVRPLATASYELVAGERRWRAAREAGLDRGPGGGPRRGRVRAPPDGADREHGPRGPQPRRRGTRLRGARRRPRPHQGGAGAPRRPQPRRGLEPDPPARPPRAGARPAALRGAQRGPRPRDPPGPRRTMPAAGSRATRPPRAGRCARRSAAPSSPRSRPARSRSAAAAAPTRRAAIIEAEDALEAALGRDVHVRATKDGLKAELVFDDLDDVRELARRLAARR